MSSETPPIVRIGPETYEEYKTRLSNEEQEKKALELKEEEKKIAQRKKEFEEALRIADLTEIDGVTAKERRDRIKSILEEEDGVTNDTIRKLRKQAVAKLPQLIMEVKKEIEERKETELEKHARESFHKKKADGKDFSSQMYRELGGAWERLGLDKTIAPLNELSPLEANAAIIGFTIAKGVYELAFALADFTSLIPVAGPIILLALMLVFENQKGSEVDVKNIGALEHDRGALKERELNNQIKKLNDPTTEISKKLKFADQYKYHILKNELEVQLSLGASAEKIKDIEKKISDIRKIDDRFQNPSADWKICFATSFNTPPLDKEPEKLLGNISETNQKILFNKAWEQNKDKLELITDPSNQFFNVKRLLKGEITLEALKAEFKALPDGAEKEKKFFSSLLGLCNSYELEKMTKENIINNIKERCAGEPKFKEGMQNLAMNNYVQSIDIQGRCLAKSGATKMLNALGNPENLEKYIKENPAKFEEEFTDCVQEGLTETRGDGINIIISNSTSKENMLNTLIHEGTHANFSACSEKFRHSFQKSVSELEKEMENKLQTKITTKFPAFKATPENPKTLSEAQIKKYLQSFGISEEAPEKEWATSEEKEKYEATHKAMYEAMVSQLQGIMNGTIPEIRDYRGKNVANNIPNIENDFFKINLLFKYAPNNFLMEDPDNPGKFIANPLQGKIMAKMQEFQNEIKGSEYEELLDIFTNTYLDPAISSSYNYNDIHEKTEECVPRLNEKLDRLLKLMPDSKNVQDIAKKCRDINAFAILTGIPLNERKWDGLGSHSHGAANAGFQSVLGNNFYPKEKQDASQLSPPFVSSDVKNGRSLNEKGQGWGDVLNEHKKALDSHGNQLAIAH